MEITSDAGKRVRCKSCDDIIQSLHVHDFRYCKCGSLAVDGGRFYLKISWTPGKEYEVLDD
tara:strand:- start:74 stop:256 length:183 start_codon:yes stop_codon:yes gene_type:complete